MFQFRPRAFTASLLTLILVCAALSPLGSTETAAQTPQANAMTTQALVALKQGQALLRRNSADQALPLLESALKLFTDAGDQVGAAATHDALGDVYQRQGQYELALPHYQTAADWYRAWKETANANLMYAKLGESFYLAGREDEARAAFARITQQPGDDAPTGGGSNNVNNNNGGGRRPNGAGGAATFAALSAAVMPGLVCSAFNNTPRNNNSTSNSPSNLSNLADAAGGAGASGPPNMGHAPKGLDGIGRMDLRVVDEAGQPVENVKAQLSTDRPNGFHCDCENVTDATGRALMNPIHIGKVLKLKLKANGYESQEVVVDPQAMGQPYRVTMRSKGGARPNASSAASRAANAATSQATNAASSQAASAPPVNSPRACFDLFALFNSYANAELGLGRMDFERGRLNEARTHFENVLAASDNGAPAAALLAARLYRAVARTSLGDIALKEGRFDDAAKLYTQAADTARKDDRLELAWAAQRGLGRARWLQAAATRDAQTAAPLRDEARRAYRAALDSVETLFAGSLRADDARTSFLARTSEVFEEAAAVSAEMALAAADAASANANRQSLAHAAPANALSGPALTYAVEAFRITEAGRARALLELIGEARADITAGVPAELLQRRADNLARQQEIAARLTGVSATNTAPDEQLTKLEAELAQLSVEAESLENQIRVASPRYNTLTRPQPLQLADVQTQVLDNDTVLLEYSLGAERSYLWAVTKNNGLTLHRLPARAVIEQQVWALREQLVPKGVRRSLVELTSDDERGIGVAAQQTEDMRGLALGGAQTTPEAVRAYMQAATTLYQTIVAPAASVIGGKRLLVVADGTLNYVPFEALLAEATGTDFSALPYLVLTNEIVYAPSASVVAALRRQQASAPTNANGGLLVVADPIFDASDPRVKQTGAGLERGGMGRLALTSALGDVIGWKPASLKLARLAGTRTEAQQIAQLARTAGANVDVWLDLDASEGNVEGRDLSRYRLVHFATHGLLDAARPQFTGLALAPAGATEADGFLRVGEVFNLRLGSPLVILSACETGLGKERRGEGVIGLTRAFMYAGAPSVGVSLWSVADRSTADLMTDFYRRYLGQERAGAPAAMRAAQQQLIAGKRYSAPFYWAPFVIVGDWK
jgi:CHAT domain-containing protein